MKDSILAIPYGAELLVEEQEHATKKQRVYDDSFKIYKSCQILIKDKTPEQAVHILNECKCCFRHQLNKPKIFEKWNGPHFSPKLKTEELVLAQLNACSCDCRFLSRWLCRGNSVSQLCCDVE